MKEEEWCEMEDRIKDEKAEARCKDATEPDYLLADWNRIWPKDAFKSEAEWLEYCRKWWPKLPSLLDALS